MACSVDVSHFAKIVINDGMVLLLPFEDPLDLFVLVCPLPLAAGSGSQEGHILKGVGVEVEEWRGRRKVCVGGGWGWFWLKGLKKTRAMSGCVGICMHLGEGQKKTMSQLVSRLVSSEKM